MLRSVLALFLLLASSTPVLAQDDCRAYFWSVVGRAEGSPAPDWKQVLESLPGKGFGTNPRPGEIQPPNAPHYGMTVMIDAGGNARGRIWLASDQFTTDGNGNRWFTHEIQVIADGPSGGFVWAWEDKGGAPPRPCGGSVPPPVTPPSDDHEARIRSLESQVKTLTEQTLVLIARVESLEAGQLTPAHVAAMIAAALDGLTVEGRTMQTGPGFLGHSHTLSLPVTRKQ